MVFHINIKKMNKTKTFTEPSEEKLQQSVNIWKTENNTYTIIREFPSLINGEFEISIVYNDWTSPIYLGD